MTGQRSYKEKPYKSRRAMLDRALSLYGWACSICGGPIADGDESLQHMKPRSKGGTDDEENLRPAHKRCNSSLGDREIDPRLIVYGGERMLIDFANKNR
ncbi:HNH endonuclease [Microbacterium sp.]|uniref:HNH endonuclease n=1 Tax=Microbacterium sp. TaxID=51671 RepID=UPI003F9721C8